MKKFIATLFLMLGALFAPTSWSSVANTPEKTLNVNGSIYSNTCLPKQFGKLKNAIQIGLPNRLNAPEAWPLINTLLCSQATKLNIDFVLEKLSNKVSVELPAATGGNEKPKLLRRSRDLAESLMAQGFAWDTSVTIGKNSIRVNYLANGTCGKSFQLKLISNKWILVSSSEICD